MALAAAFTMMPGRAPFLSKLEVSEVESLPGTAAVSLSWAAFPCARGFSSPSSALWTVLFIVKFPLEKGVEEGTEGTLTVEVNDNVKVAREIGGVEEGTGGTVTVEFDSDVEGVEEGTEDTGTFEVNKNVDVDREVTVEREIHVCREVKVDKDVAVAKVVKLERVTNDDEVLVEFGGIADVDMGLGATETETVGNVAVDGELEIDAVEDAAVDEELEIELEVGLSGRRATYSKRLYIDTTTFSLVAQCFPPGLKWHSRTSCKWPVNARNSSTLLRGESQKDPCRKN